MRHQERRDSKSFLIVDEDYGIPSAVIDNYRAGHDNGPLARLDPRSLLLSMSEYNKPPGYDDVYEYKPTTRSEHGLDYSSLGAQQTYTSQYVGTQAQVPAGLPRSTALSMVPPAQQYSGPHDPVYNQHPDQQYAPQPAYLDTSPRQAPEIISFAPPAGYQGSRVTVYFRSIYDFESPPIQTFLMFGTHRCQSTLMKTAQQNDMYQYELTADAPPFSVTSSPSPTPLRLLFDESLIQWSSPTLDVGSFTYLNTSLYNYLAASPETAEGATRKRKLSPQASPRRSPTKKASFPQLPRPSRISAQPYANTLPANTQIPQFRRPSLPEAYLQQRRVSSEYHPTYSTPAYSAPLPTPQQYYGGQLVGQTTPGLQPPPSPSWAYQHSGVPISRSPSTAAISVGERNPHLRPSPVGGSNPPLVRTSTLQQSPTTPASTIPTFNPYAIYPSNAKANLAIEGELASMADSWSTAEWEARRRLVQFSRSQTGSVISAKFEAVTPEARAPNSICVSCIWWTEKNECYVTSVDTIQLLEALVAVRFTVEEKNRIRRNLEGFRPATVSKAKADSEEFFKLIMGFPNPKPRNIEKDVKVFPWRILATALKKIIGKYATGALHAPGAGPSYTATRNSDAGLGYDTAQAQQYQRATIGASPRSTSSSATSHAYAPAHTLVTTNAYSPHATDSIASSSAGLGQLPLPPDLRLAVPGAVAGAGGHQTTSWHQPSAHYADMAASTQQHNRDAWEYSSYISHSPATGLPGSAPSYGYQQQPMRLPSFSAQPAMSSEARFVPLHDYEDPGQPTTAA
ncbi:hypothetical protein LTR91_023929 [Friedmanniomyces endolithicus]|uniref:DUF7082 domain-containing protein n=1 Tax=Friedmanniomyces endolithicus TaxID=329885 RepID=A0AAN6JXC2_9PEZI|nr:hypothetical protein LTR57_023291 [Friedmanniomyces endolithicus]KAK0953273.1 hypothetical protein LTR91_023929 [Friedmanniomyces endolithicus]KAK0955729.1 hypothetical protein LTS01_023210 [Friedmanniomyces endolithicus]